MEHNPETVTADVGDFASALDAGLPPHGFWSGPVVVAVSGGADSVALLLGLQALAATRGSASRLLVAHARHDLREDAAADADFVVDLAATLGIPAVIRSLQVRVPEGRGADGERGEGVEARARRLRYGFLTEVARERGARFVVVAHTADDQAETILHRGLRGTGLSGLTGMAVARPLDDGLTLLRPLLHVPRRLVREYLTARGQAWCEDATNADLRFARNFLRHAILARCEAGPYPAATAALVRLGGQAAAMAGALRSAAEHLLEKHAQRHADGSIVVQAGEFVALDPHLIGEILVALWRREGWPQRDMTARHYGQLVAMLQHAGEPLASEAAAHRPPAVDLPGGGHARVTRHGLLVLAPPRQ